MYKGVSVLGFGEFTSLFSTTDQFRDGFSRGVQHLFHKDYSMDLLQVGITLNKIGGNIEYGNLCYNGKRSPQAIDIENEGFGEAYKLNTLYKKTNSNITRTTSAYSLEKAIVMEEIIRNDEDIEKQIEQYGYLFYTNDDTARITYDSVNDCTIWTNSKNKNIIMGLSEKSDNFILSKEHRGFAIRTIEKILHSDYSSEVELDNNYGISSAIGRKIILLPNEQSLFRWFIIPCEDIKTGIELLNDLRNDDVDSIANKLYTDFFANASQMEDEKLDKLYKRNMLLIKGVNLNGMIPADITGHYFTNGLPCFYPRDSMMVARSFLVSGYLDESKKIIEFLASRPMKAKGEFYQRYNAIGEGSEGANNDVHHQLDSNGYFLSLIKQYYDATNVVLVEPEFIQDVLECIKVNQTYNGLVGAEGGVNEGVYGASYITSSNMFIAGGIYGIMDLCNIIDSNNEIWNTIRELCRDIIGGLEKGIDSMWNSNYYSYGYSQTIDMKIDKYDTPQYFSVLYGYPNNIKLQKNNKYLLENASYYSDGIGYSQQAYHDGPWVFNTAACAQYNYLDGNIDEYNKKIKWLLNHSNSYGTMPEAIDSNNEKNCFINPLTWACGEVTAALALMSKTK